MTSLLHIKSIRLLFVVGMVNDISNLHRLWFCEMYSIVFRLALIDFLLNIYGLCLLWSIEWMVNSLQFLCRSTKNSCKSSRTMVLRLQPYRCRGNTCAMWERTPWAPPHLELTFLKLLRLFVAFYAISFLFLKRCIHY